ncbi:MAG: DUF418 domain-containing protein, partial [Proteobacteria bacterium]|nr:DUF418 domain-containing protein [Pseudomonadota bacterium]
MSSTNQAVARSPAPVDPRRRIEVVDMVRGFALFGVLLVNMFNFGAYSIVWNEPGDELALFGMQFFFETKSWRLFSFLFGFGFALQLIRAEERGSKFAPVYLRRLIILFVIGAGHAMIYGGDILMLYAELGLVLVLFRKVPPRLLLVLAVGLLAVNPIGRAVTSLLEPTQNAQTIDYAVRLEEATAEIEEDRQTHVYAVGSMREVMADNAHLKNPFRRLLGSESSLAMFAMFLLGLYVGRRRIFQDIPKHMQLIRRVFWWGLTIGFVSVGADRILRPTDYLPLQLLGSVLYIYGNTFLAFGYAAGITLLAQHPRGRRLLAPFGAAGRLALTVYISSSIMFGILFYGFAFGNVFWLGPVAVTAYAVLFFAILIVFSVWWTKRFRFGPMEWVWRALTYLKF